MDEAISLFKEYIAMENLFFIPFLLFVGKCIKKSTRIDDTMIPNILGVLGIFLCSLVSFATNQPITWINWVILITVSIGQGICVAGVAVFINQWLKQKDKYKQMSGFDGEDLPEHMRHDFEYDNLEPPVLPEKEDVYPNEAKIIRDVDAEIDYILYEIGRGSECPKD